MLALAIVAATSVVASADTVANNLVSSTNVLTVERGSSGSVTYTVTNTNSGNDAYPDPNNACNVAGSGRLRVTPTGLPTGVSAGNVSLDACGVGGSITFVVGSTAPLGDHAIGHTLVAENGATGTFYNLANFTLRVVASDPTPPIITPNVSGTLGSNGWYTGDVSVTWTVSDAESEILSRTGCGPTLISSDTPGEILTCSASSAGGSNSGSITIKRDSQAPNSPTYSLSAPANFAGWHKEAVTVSFASAGDNGPSGIAYCTGPTLVASDTTAAGQDVAGTCTDDAGNTSSPTTANVKLDTQAPNSPTYSLSAPANLAGWHKEAVTVSFVAAGDNGSSGVASCTGPTDVTGDTSSDGQDVEGSCTDVAGNTSSPTTVNVKLDTQAPAVSLAGGPSHGVTYYYGFVPTAPTCSATDLGSSGLVGSCTVSGYSSALGSHTITGSQSDLAGNTGSASASYTVASWTTQGFFAPVSMSGVNTVKGGSTVPLKFRVYAGASELTSVPLVGASVQYRKTACDPSDGEWLVPTDADAAGGTQLRYADGHFIYNWKTPTAKGCYQLTIRLADGTPIVAEFKTK